MSSLLTRATVFSLVLFILTASGEDKTVSLDSAYKHPETGLIFPRELSDFKIRSLTNYETTKNGVSIRYRMSDEVRADVYLYNLGMARIIDDEKHEALHQEVGSTIRQIQAMEKRGYFRDVKVSNEGTLTKFGEEDPFCFLQTQVTFRHGNKADQESLLDRIPRRSLIAVGIFENHFIKIRYSFPVWDEEADAEREKMCREFVSSIGQLVLESKLWPEIRKAIETYHHDPLSDEGREAAGAIVAFADASKLIEILIDPAHLPFFTVEDYPYSTELLAAFIAGNVKAQFESGNYESRSLAGVTQMLEVYGQLKRKHNARPVEGMETFVKAQEAGNLKAALESADHKD